MSDMNTQVHNRVRSAHQRDAGEHHHVASAKTLSKPELLHMKLVGKARVQRRLHDARTQPQTA